jgi:hypothetical protein
VTISISHIALRDQIADAIEIGLIRDNWSPLTWQVSPKSEDIAIVRKLFARERANNIVQSIAMDAELDEEGRAA